jgi:hypothetical protein
MASPSPHIASCLLPDRNGRLHDQHTIGVGPEVTVQLDTNNSQQHPQPHRTSKLTSHIVALSHKMGEVQVTKTLA